MVIFHSYVSLPEGIIPLSPVDPSSISWLRRSVILSSLQVCARRTDYEGDWSVHLKARRPQQFVGTVRR